MVYPHCTLDIYLVYQSASRPQGISGLSLMKKPPSESDFERYNSASVGGGGEGHNLMEKYAQENLNIHTRGLLRKKVPVMDMISWTKVKILCEFYHINYFIYFLGGTTNTGHNALYMYQKMADV